MKTSIVILASAFCFSPLLVGQEAPTAFSWTSSDGKTIRAEFVQLENETVVILKDGRKFNIPLAKLSLASREQARKLAAAAPNPAISNEIALANVPGVTAIKQTDLEHQRKLVESVLSKKGTASIWRGTGQLAVSRVENLPKGKLELRTIRSVDGPFTNEDAELINGCNQLTELEIHRGTMASLPLKSLSALSSLTLLECRLDASTFRGLRGSKTLANATIGGEPLNPEIVAILATCSNLQNVNLERCGLANVSLIPFKNLKFLKSLNVGGNALTGEELQGIGEISSLENLALPNMDLANETLAFLPKLRSLISLTLSDCKVSSKVLASASATQHLTRLDLWNTDVTDEMLTALSGKKELNYLGLGQTVCTGESFGKFGLLPNLTDLRLQGSRTCVSDVGIAAIVKACPSLKTIYLGGKVLSPTGLEHLLSLKQLSEIRLNDLAPLDNSFIGSLAQMRKLTILEISSSSLTDAQVALLEPLKGNLETLYVQNNRISDATVETFKKMKALKMLDISGTDISKPAVEEIRKSLSPCDIHY